MIAANVSRDWLKKKKPSLFQTDEDEKKQLESVEEISENFLPQDYMDSEEKYQTIKKMVDDLPDKQRVAVIYYYYDELSVPSISQLMETTDGTTKSRLNYARKQIKSKVEAEEQRGNKLYAARPT